MANVIDKKGSSSSTAHSHLSSLQLPFSTDCSPFLNWDEAQCKTVDEQAVIFRSLVTTVKSQPALDASLEGKAVKLLQSMDPKNEESAAAFLSNIASSSDGSWSNFIWCFVVLVSSPSQVITTTTIEMLDSLIMYCSIKVRFALVKTNLIHQIINTLNPQSLPLAEAVDIHINIMRIIRHLILVATPNGLAELRLKDGDEQQAVHETVLQRVLAPSEKYFCHLCMNHFSIIDGKLCDEFMYLLAWPVEICPYYQPTMDLILHMPVFITIPSCLTFFENDTSIRNFLHVLGISQREWNKAKGEERQMGKKVQRMLRMEGIEDVIEQKLQNDKNEFFGGWIVDESIEWNKLRGMNIPRRE